MPAKNRKSHKAPKQDLTITLSVVDGHIKYDGQDYDPNDPPRVFGGGTLNWGVEDPTDLWAVEFVDSKSGGASSDGDGPFHDRKKKRHKHDGQPRKVRGSKKQPLRFAYTVAMYHHDTNTVYLEDPEVIIEPVPSPQP